LIPKPTAKWRIRRRGSKTQRKQHDNGVGETSAHPVRNCQFGRPTRWWGGEGGGTMGKGGKSKESSSVSRVRRRTNREWNGTWTVRGTNQREWQRGLNG